MKFKLSPKTLLDKRQLLMMTSVESRDKSTFYRPKKRLEFCIAIEEVGML